DYYFARYDSEYNAMLKDHKLVRKFVQYEKECKEDSIEEFGDYLILDTGDNKKKRKGLFKLFGKNKQI
ncbi:MAG: hypothetical protein MR780_04180, partial [Lachnospiraceae bacterium]|nr:hypothetical protein [Lachnospiraceae bacterium]